MSKSDKNIITTLAKKIERIRRMEPGSIERQYRQMIDRGFLSTRESARLLHQHLENLKKRRCGNGNSRSM